MAADLDGTQDSHRLPLRYTGATDSDLDQDRIPDLIHHASTGLQRSFEKPTLAYGASSLAVDLLHNLQAYDVDLAVEWTTTLTSSDWHTATYDPAEDIPHNDGTLTRRWILPADEPKLFYRLKATQ